jgi:hypothetical protein
MKISTDTITIATAGGSFRIAVDFRIGEFCVHESQGHDVAGCWTVTHLPTGMACFRTIKDAATARSIARWTKVQFDRFGVDAKQTDQDFLSRTPEGKQLGRVLNRRRIDLQVQRNAHPGGRNNHASV